MLKLGDGLALAYDETGDASGVPVVNKGWPLASVWVKLARIVAMSRSAAIACVTAVSLGVPP